MDTTRRKFMKGLLPALGLVALGIKEGLSGQDEGIIEMRSGYISTTFSDNDISSYPPFPDGSEDDGKMNWMNNDSFTYLGSGNGEVFNLTNTRSK